MKRVFTLLALIPFFSYGQELQVQLGSNAKKLSFESTVNKRNEMMYCYTELQYGDQTSVYTQVFYEYNLFSFSPHIEYRNMSNFSDDDSNIFLVGLTIPIFYNANAFANITPLYRFDDMSAWQLSTVYGYSKHRLSFFGYIDIYGTNNFTLFSENKLKFLIGNTFIGLNVECYATQHFKSIAPLFLIGFTM